MTEQNSNYETHLMRHESGIINGYHLLTKSVAKQAYQDMLFPAKMYFKEFRRNIKPSADEISYKRRFNSIANWFYQGDFSGWYSPEVGEYIIGQAKKRAYKSIYHAELGTPQMWNIVLIDEIDEDKAEVVANLYMNGDYTKVKKQIIKKYGDNWDVEWTSKNTAKWIMHKE